VLNGSMTVHVGCDIFASLKIPAPSRSGRWQPGAVLGSQPSWTNANSPVDDIGVAE
jgi:hypothetical protein